MDILFILAILNLLLFMVLATYDGAYLHLWKYELFNREESTFEHKTHTLRAILFPIIVFLFCCTTNITSFIIGILLVIVDLIVLALDAYSEKESRSFMDGLPRWEYILHLFANGFHFAFVIIIISTRVSIEGNSIQYTVQFIHSAYFELLQKIAINILPGAITLGVLHVVLLTNYGKHIWQKTRSRIQCC